MVVGRRTTGTIIGLAAGMFVLGGSAVAGSSMTTGHLTSQPIGHYEFCRANPRECNINVPDNGPLRLTSATWRKISSINAGVNRAVTPMNDYDIYGKDEVWAYPAGAGDCEDYVLEKRRELQKAGISLSDLLITVVRKPDGEGHAVLTVRTDKGDFILDNLTDAVRSWDKTGYRFLKRQASNYPGHWVSLRTGSNPVVGSVNR